MTNDEFQRRVLAKLELLHDKVNKVESDHRVNQQKLCDIHDDLCRYQTWLQNHQSELNGSGEYPGLKVRVDRIESDHKRYGWFIKTAMGTGIAAVIGWIWDFLKGTKH